MHRLLYNPWALRSCPDPARPASAGTAAPDGTAVRETSARPRSKRPAETRSRM